MKKFLVLIFIFAHTFLGAQNTNRKFISYTQTEATIEIKVSDGKYVIKPYSNQIVETTFSSKGEPLNIESHAVVLSPQPRLYKVIDDGNVLTIRTNGIAVKIQKTPFIISYSYHDKILLSEKNGWSVTDSLSTIDFNIESNEALYGGGSRAVGLNRRGNLLKLRNEAHYGYGDYADQLNFCIPLVLSSKIYAVHFDNTAIGFIDLDSKKQNTISYGSAMGRKTYQVIAADTWPEMLQQYTSLTGRQPLLPRWALGNFSSRFGYHDQDQVMKTVGKFAQDSIPLDAIILDLYWFGKSVKGTMGNLQWDRDNFPQPEQMMQALNEKNIKTILISEPFVLTTSKKWTEASQKNVLATDQSGRPFVYDFYFGNTGIIDVFKPSAQNWFWNIYKDLIDQGVGGWWGDLGEPEALPAEAVTAAGPAKLIHNIYGHNWAKLISDGYRKDFPNVRPFILMRAGYSGSQRFGIVPWSGDVSRSWQGLQSQPEIALEMGMQGIGFMHSDLGGFAGDYFDDELYLRWLQYGIFQPIFRPHAHEDVAPEPVYKEIRTKAKAKKLVELRYQMLPYNYTIAFENSRTGMPLMRPLLFEEPQNSALLGISSTFLWGPDLLVTPITKPGQTDASIYFPKNNNWFDFFTGQKYPGGSNQVVATAEDHIPVFVRGGAFIPMVATIQNTAAYALKQFDLHYYFDTETRSSTGLLYQDDGQTPDSYAKGQYEIMRFSSSIKGKKLSLLLKAETGKNFATSNKNPTLIIHNLSAKKVSVNGKSVTFKSNNNSLEIEVNWEKLTVKDILIEW